MAVMLHRPFGRYRPRSLFVNLGAMNTIEIAMNLPPQKARLVSHDREKLINAIVFFAKNTRYLGKIKLFKLLYLLDFEHFRLTGKSVTGMKYHAWRLGPVPIDLAQEWDELQPDMAHSVSIRPEQVIDYMRESVHARVDFDSRFFSPRERGLMTELANKYKDVQSHSMIDITHAENGAWATVWRGGEGSDQPIDYALALSADDPGRDVILELAREYAATQQQV